MTAPHPDHPLSSRMTALEAAVEEIRQTLKALSPIVQSIPTPPTTPTPTGEAAPLTRDMSAAPASPTPVTEELPGVAPGSLSRARVICSHCDGGNPAGADRCMWCGSLMSTTHTPRPTAIRAESSAQQVAPAATPKVRVVASEDASYKPRPAVTPSTAQPSVAKPKPQQNREPDVPRQPISATILHAAETWLNKVGIVLFLFGVAFLFKYSVDQGWLNEQVRVGLGMMFGTVLLSIGLWVHSKRRHFGQVLMGGGIATYYITGYAAYNIFPNLNVPYQVAFAFMALVTVAAFALSVRQNEAVLAIIAVNGGLLTPFVLNRAEIELPALVVYTCLVIAGACGIYLVRGWRSLLWTCVPAAWIILLHGYSSNVYYESGFRPVLTLSDRWTLQLGAAFTLLAFWAIPVLRTVLSSRNPVRWPDPPAPTSFANADFRNLIARHAHLLTIATPIMALSYSAGVWSNLVSKEMWGVVVLGLSALFASTYFAVRRYAPALQTLAYTHAIVAIGLLTTGLVSLLEGDTLIFVLAVEGAALHLIARRSSDRGIALCGSFIFGAVGVWLAWRFLPGHEQLPAIWNAQALTDLAVIAVALLASFAAYQPKIALAVRSLVHVAVMAWLWREIHAFENGDGYVMLAWATYGLMLHAVSRFTKDQLNSVGATIAAHLAFEGAVAILALRLATHFQGDTAILNEKAVIDLAFMALALAASFLVRGGTTGSLTMATVYRLGIHVAALAWLYRESTPLDQSGGYLMLRWAAYLATVAFISHRVGDRITLMFTSIPFVGVAFILAGRIMAGHQGEWAVLNPNTLVDLGVLALALAVSYVAQPREIKTAYRIGIHMAVLGLLWREIFWWEGGSDSPLFQFIAGDYGYVMLAWAAYLAALHILSRWTQDEATSIFAHAGFICVGGLLAWRLAITHEIATAFLNQKALLDMAVIALIAVTSFLARPKEAGPIYRYAVHAAVLALLAGELHWLTEGWSYIMLAWAAYGALLYLASRWVKGEVLDVAAHALFALCGVWLMVRIVNGLILKNPDQFAVFNLKGLTFVGVIALGGATYAMVRWLHVDSPLAKRRREIALTYAVWLHIAFLGWTWQELGLIPNGGNGYVSIAWGLYALGLVAAGLRPGRDRNVPLLTAGITTLFAIPAKLFLIDLQYVDTIWRILLFLGFGGFFLLFSYYFQGKLRPERANGQR